MSTASTETLIERYFIETTKATGTLYGDLSVSSYFSFGDTPDIGEKNYNRDK